MSKRFAILLVVATTVGCPGLGDRELSGPPDVDGGVPSYTGDILPIFETYCLACHSAPPDNGAPGSFRLDVCEDEDILGAQSQAARVIARVVESPDFPMPPFAPFPDATEMAFLQAWLDGGAPCD